MSEPKFGEKFYKHNGRITILQISAATPGWWVETDEGSSPWHHGRFVCLVTLTAMCIRIFCL